jgi:hypothetical protein
MNPALTFLGELELSQDRLQNTTFADFDRLPHIQLIRSLANEFAGVIELMPYHKDGDEMRLLVSVYLQPKSSSGKVIAVLTRGLYPQDVSGLQQIVDLAAQRLLSLEAIGDRFEEGSIQTSQEYLKELSLRIEQSL